MAKIKVIGYLHSSKEEMYEIGKENGLKGKALDNFCYALYEVTIPMLVDTKTGKYEIIKDEVEA